MVSLAQWLQLTVKSNSLHRLCNSVTKGHSSNAGRVREYGIETDSHFFVAAVRRIYTAASKRKYRSSLVHWLEMKLETEREGGTEKQKMDPLWMGIELKHYLMLQMQNFFACTLYSFVCCMYSLCYPQFVFNLYCLCVFCLTYCLSRSLNSVVSFVNAY